MLKPRFFLNTTRTYDKFLFRRERKLDEGYPTLSNWRKKVGYYCLQQAMESADDWGIILDESIQLGTNKLLLILGIRDSFWDFERPLLTDMEILYMASHSPCNTPVIVSALEKVKQKWANLILPCTVG